MLNYCIKTNNIEILEFIQTEIKKMNIDGIFLSRKKFKIYNNVIIHYKGENEKKFIYELCNALGSCIVYFYEEIILKKYIKYEFFYFEKMEQKIILEICLKIIKSQEEQFGFKNEILKELIFDYLIESNIIVLDGLINFRIKEYKEILEYIAEIAVANYIRYV